MNTAEARKELGKVLRFLKPLTHAEEALAVAMQAEEAVAVLKKTHAELVAENERLGVTAGELTSARDEAVHDLSNVREETRLLRVAVVAVEQETSVEIAELQDKVTAARTAYADLISALQGDVDEIEYTLVGLRAEETRVETKIAQFEALRGQDGGSHDGD